MTTKTTSLPSPMVNLLDVIGTFPPLLDDWTGAQSDFVIHTYRQEMLRLVQYQIRLDRTVTWAVLAVVSLSALIIRTSDIPHWLFFLVVVVAAAAFAIDIRRSGLLYRSAQFVETVEQLYFGTIVLGKQNATAGPFHPSSLLYSQLKAWADRKISPPSYAYHTRERMEAVYGYLLAGIYLAWILKLSMEEPFPTVPLWAASACLAASVAAWIVVFYKPGLLLEHVRFE